MDQFDPARHPHRRRNPLLDEWVLVSPHRTQRPWLGAEEAEGPDTRPDYDPACYLCPGNERAGGHRNPTYEDTFVFTNDFAALLPSGPLGPEMAPAPKLFMAQPVSGECRVLCFSPQHNLTIAKMDHAQIERIVGMWQAQARELGERYAWVQIFENHGSAMGASNPHPHGQVWATDSLPSIPSRELRCQAAYFAQHGGPLLLAYVQQELERGERIVLETDHWVWMVPFWATWPFEVLLLPKRWVSSLVDMSPEESSDLARVLKAGLIGYDRLFGTDFPYSMGWHGAPRAGSEGWQLHAHFYPPLLRSATVKKFMVGFEMLAEAQRDITPEQAAARLRDVTPKVYL